MKKFFTIFAVLAVLISFSGCTEEGNVVLADFSASDNLILNNDFENNLTSWSTFPGSRGSRTAQSTAVDSGSYSLKLHSDAGVNYNVVQQSIAVTPGAKYTLTGRIKASFTSGVCQVDVYKYPFIDTDEINVRASTDWQGYVQELTIPSNVSLISIRLMQAGNPVGDCYFDGLSLVEVVEATIEDPEYSCEDSDTTYSYPNGKNFDLKGTIQGTTFMTITDSTGTYPANTEATLTDYCTSDTFLREYFCSESNQVTFYLKSCSCVNGECVISVEPDCTVATQDVDCDAGFECNSAGVCVAVVPDCTLLGDVDGDGAVTCVDSELISNYLIGTVQESEIDLLCADVTEDGEVTIGDVIQLGVINNLVCDCTADADCASGEECNSAGECVAVVVEPDCTVATQVVDCASGEVCNSAGVCVAIVVEPECTIDSDCDEGQECDDAGECVVVEPISTGTGIITVNVIDRAGNNISGAEIKLYEWTGSTSVSTKSGLASTWNLLSTKTTRASGEVKFTSLLLGEYKISVKKTGYTEATEVTLILSSADQDKGKEIILRAFKGSLEITVADAVGAVSGATVEIVNSEGANGDLKTTNSSGKVLFEELTSGDYFVEILKENYTPLRGEEVTVVVNTDGQLNRESFNIKGIINPPENLTLTPGFRQITLEWSAPSSGAAPESYIIQRGTSLSGNMPEIKRGFRGTEFVDEDLRDNTTYYYFVRSFAANDMSGGSSVVNATTSNAYEVPKVESAGSYRLGPFGSKEAIAECDGSDELTECNCKVNQIAGTENSITVGNSCICSYTTWLFGCGWLGKCPTVEATALCVK